MRTGPSEAATLERAVSLASETMRSLEMQKRRLRSEEPEDSEWLFRWWADLQFFIVTLRRMRRVAELVKEVPSVRAGITTATAAFDSALPMLQKMRNVGEHIDEYALDRGRNQVVTRGMLQVGTWNGESYQWLDETLNVTDAHNAAVQLYSAIRKALEDFPNRS